MIYIINYMYYSDEGPFETFNADYVKIVACNAKKPGVASAAAT